MEQRGQEKVEVGGRRREGGAGRQREEVEGKLGEELEAGEMMPTFRRIIKYIRPHKKIESTHHLTATPAPINQNSSVMGGGKSEHTQNNKAGGYMITSRGGMKAITHRGWSRD